MDRNEIEEPSTGTAVVIGAGTMGRGIAADIANAGWHVHLWDVTPEVAAGAVERVRANRPPLLFLDRYAERILPGSLDANANVLAGADWVVEAVAESPDVKAAVFDRIEPLVGPETMVTSNTSGLSLNMMAAGRHEKFRRRFFGTHFLNPPRYLKLLEVIPTADTNPGILARFTRFAENDLGHRVVVARDTPGFISTRLWIAHLMDTIHATLEAGLDFATADALTGPFLGRPKSATFRMADVVGLDIIAAVAANQYAALPGDPLRERLLLPPVLRELLARGWHGEKAGAGFYRKEGREILVLDPSAMEYRPRPESAVAPADLSALPLPERLAALRERDDAPAPRWANALLDRLTDYAEAVGPEIADDVLAIDRTLQWGFGWEMGPFALADARATGEGRNYRRYQSEDEVFAGTPPSVSYRVFPDAFAGWPDEPQYVSLRDLKGRGGLVESSPVASLVRLGVGVYCAEFHTKMNTLNPDVCEFLLRAVERANRDGCALVVGNEGPHFCAGYDLTRLVTHMEAGDWAAIDREMELCQRAFHALKHSPLATVAAPRGFTLGGGAEVALHCHFMQAAPELAIGLPESLVGLIPCGGGTKEVLFRALARVAPEGEPSGEAVLAAARETLATVARPRHSANAHDARAAGWLRPEADPITRNADRHLYDAFLLARRPRDSWTTMDLPRPVVPVVGPSGLDALRADIERWRGEGAFTAHDARVADAVARLLSGDGATAPALSEPDYFALERRLFLELCREPLTLARTKHLMETGKHLKN
jgi:3-hydroxyacyl-CoA dehydrogenase